MDIGLAWFPTDTSVDPVTLGRVAEERGFESLMVAEHTHIPVSRESPYPGGGPLPEEYRRTLDPFVTLTAVAAATERLVVGTAVCLVCQHDPVTLAKQAASLQLLSGGRFVMGVGPGWNADEMATHGVAFDDRFAQMRERIELVRALWTQDVASYEGEHVRLEPSWAWPKPPVPIPVLVAGWGPTVLDRVLDYGDGWIPIAGRAGELAVRIDELQRRAADQGRGPLDVTVWHPRPTAEAAAELASAGVSRMLCAVPGGTPEEQLGTVDRHAALLA